MGRAIADYWKTKKADRLRVFSPMFEEDEIPLQTLFRKYEDMPEIERKALDMIKGKTLDVGAGSGCHSASECSIRTPLANLLTGSISMLTL